MMFPFDKKIRAAYFLITSLLVACVFLVSTCNFNSGDEKLTGIVHPSGEEFAGSESCKQCHQSIADSFGETPHFLTSRPGSKATVKGNLDSGENVLALNERLKVFIEERDGKVYQRASVNGKDVDTKPIDISVGSGRQGQTYLYWQGDSLFQLPASYHAAAKAWANSPGYPSDQIVFNRSISARCLECHSTYFKVERTFGDVETFARSKVLLGVDCERCHGPSARHVKFHREHPDETKARYVVNTQKLEKKLRLDNCALCHSGMRTNLMPSFSYVAGDNLDKYFIQGFNADSGSTLDVHGNQVGLLTASKCYQMSEMDCSSCHNVHMKETKNLELFSTRCMNCHQAEGNNFCKQPPVQGLILSKNCIDCHMPSLPSRKVFLQSPGTTRPTPFFVRTHLVGNYKKQVEIFLERIGKDSVESNK
jgi:hypothetical protein